SDPCRSPTTKRSHRAHGLAESVPGMVHAETIRAGGPAFYEARIRNEATELMGWQNPFRGRALGHRPGRGSTAFLTAGYETKPRRRRREAPFLPVGGRAIRRAFPAAPAPTQLRRSLGLQSEVKSR